MKTQSEIWKDIPDYEGLYQASNLGRIRSLDKVLKGKGRNQFGSEFDMIKKGKIMSIEYRGAQKKASLKRKRNELGQFIGGGK